LKPLGYMNAEIKHRLGNERKIRGDHRKTLYSTVK